ncbi:hypothetical protein IG631_21680 [Alternaria alternata]|nr:hypothetical protein IG631_21680 [Alternaria alternata]
MKTPQALHTIENEDSSALGDAVVDCGPSDTNLDGSESSDSPWEVSSDSETEPSTKGDHPYIPDRSRTEVPPLLPGVVATHSLPLSSAKFVVDCLWKLPIRRPAPVDRMRKKATKDTSGYVPFDILYVKDKFPDLNETVALRLAKMISRRRQLIVYRKDHTRALRHEETQLPDRIQLYHRHRYKEDGDDGFSETNSSFKTPSETTVITKATTLKPDALVSAMKPRVGLYAPSISSSGSSTASEQAGKDITIRIPNRPIGKDGKALAQFVCPYCSTAQFITEERQWK